MIAIGKIEHKVYKKFILRHFNKANKVVNPEIIDNILSISHLHTYYVQAMANLLFSQQVMPETTAEFELIYRDFILEKSVFYSELPEMLTKQQFSVIKAFAKAGNALNPTSADFMETAKIRNSSSMHRAINSLLDKQLIIKDDGELRLYDVYLEHFLKYTQ
jgi:hypothetical protein